MIVDFHTHVFPDKIAKTVIKNLSNRSGTIPSTDGSINGLLSHMLNCGVDVSITLPVITNPSQFDSINRFAVFINENYSNKQNSLISFGGIHPACENIKEKMKFLKDCGLKGVKIHPDYQETFIDDDGYIQILKTAKDLDMIVITHSGVDDGYPGVPIKCPPSLALKVIDKVNHDKFVLGHYGGHSQWDEVYRLLAGKNVYFDTAFTFHQIEKQLFINILDKHGEDKILFATDCPWRSQSEDISILNSIGLSKQTLDKIFYKNALNLLNSNLLENY